MIPNEAVEAAAEWLPHSDDCEVRPERDCTCWHPRVAIMRAALEAAAPHMLACHLHDGANPHRDGDVQPNPYRKPTQ